MNVRVNVPKKAASALLVAVFATLVGCAGPQQAVGPEQHVASLAATRWEWMIDGEWKQAYDMLTPGYRALHPLKEYRAQFNSPQLWQKAQIVKTSCEGNKCDVQVALTVKVPFARKPEATVETNFTETWLREGDRWYHYEKP